MDAGGGGAERDRVPARPDRDPDAASPGVVIPWWGWALFAAVALAVVASCLANYLATARLFGEVNRLNTQVCVIDTSLRDHHLITVVSPGCHTPSP